MGVPTLEEKIHSPFLSCFCSVLTASWVTLTLLLPLEVLGAPIFPLKTVRFTAWSQLEDLGLPTSDSVALPVSSLWSQPEHIERKAQFLWQLLARSLLVLR